MIWCVYIPYVMQGRRNTCINGENLMKRRTVVVTLAVSCIVVGCVLGKIWKYDHRTEYRTEVKSSVEQEDCFLCGSNSLISYYEKKDSIGVIHWNSGTVTDTEVGEYGNEREELSGQGVSTKINSFGAPYGSLMISAMSDRRISEVTVHYEDADKAAPDALEELLCRDCLEQVSEFYADRKDQGDAGCIAAKGYCLVDFQTMQLYTLSDPPREYFIRDYHVEYEIKEDSEDAGNRIRIQIFYVPERDP